MIDLWPIVGTSTTECVDSRMSATGRRTAVDVTDGDGAVGYNGVRDGSNHRPDSGVHSRKMAWFRAAANVTQAMYENRSIPAVRPTHPDATQGRRDGCPEQDDLAGRMALATSRRRRSRSRRGAGPFAGLIVHQNRHHAHRLAELPNEHSIPPSRPWVSLTSRPGSRQNLPPTQS